MLKKILTFICFVALVSVPTASIAKPIVLKTAWLGEHETFIIWYAKQKGWDIEAGYDLEFLHFNSGKEIVDGKKAYKWAIAGMGAVPALMGTLSNELDIIAIANDESAANAIYVPADSPLLDVRGYNPSFPSIYGSPTSLGKKQILTTKGTSAHYTLIAWLKNLGISANDANIQFMDQRAQLGTIKNKYGQVYGFWSPHTIEAEKQGLKVVATGEDCQIMLPIVLVASKQYAKQYPKHVEDFLKIYMRGINALSSQPLQNFVVDYVAFYKEWAGLDISKEQALLDLENHPVFPLNKQIDMFSTANGESFLQKELRNIVDFYEISGIIAEKDKKHMLNPKNISDKFLKAISK